VLAAAVENHFSAAPVPAAKGATPYAQLVQDAVDMLKADPAMAARVADVFRKYNARSCPRAADEEIVGFDRRIIRSYLEKPPVCADEDPNAPFYIVDLGQMVVQMAKFRKHLPGVAPYYAIKCNNSECLIAMIAALGGSYDCASLPEIKAVLDPGYAHVLAPGSAEGQRGGNIIYANPAKPPYHMQNAERLGVKRITFDNEMELEKVQRYMPSAEAVLRIRTNDQNAVCQFSSKFGCPMRDARDVLTRAKDLGVNVVGVSFHVGSGNNDVTAYHQALRDARALFDFGATLGYDMRVVDLGGGWAGSDPKIDADGKPEFMCFEDLTAELRPVLYELFPADQYELIAEPGRFFAASSHTLALSVHSKRIVNHADGTCEHQCYLTDGMYQSFNCIYFDHVNPFILQVNPDGEGATRTTTMFGPTCDGMDVMMKCVPFPELDVNEWLMVPEFGAYTVAAGSAFNGYQTKRREFISSLPAGAVPM
jgi:ornithine decarboxylase